MMVVRMGTGYSTVTGIAIQDNRITPLPYIGAGLSYSLVEW